MTVESTINRVDIVAAAGQTTFAFGFKYFVASDIQVFINDVEQTTGFTVVASPQGTDNGGTVVFTTAPAENAEVTLLRVLPLTQTSDYEEGDRLPSQQLEDDLDRQTMINQQQQEDLARRPALASTSLVRDVVIVEPTSAIVGHAFVWREAVPGTFSIGASARNIDDAVDQLDQIVTDVQDDANAAAASATAAANSATAAAASAAAAATSETNVLNVESSVIAQGNTQVARVTAEGDTQVARVQSVGSGIAAPADVTENDIVYNFDAQVGVVDEDVTRASRQRYVSPSGRIFLSANNEIISSYQNGSYGFEIFEGRTNLTLRSEEFAGAFWTFSSVTSTVDADIAPNGTQTADRITELNANAVHGVLRNMTILPQRTVTVSFHLKSNGRRYGRLRSETNVGFINSITFDLVAGTITGGNENNIGNIERLENGWFRVSLSFVTQAGTTSLVSTGVHMLDMPTGGSGVGDAYQGDGTSGMFFWGAQIEYGVNASPYLQTSTAVSGRPATDISVDVSTFLNTTQGTFVVDVTKLGTEGLRVPLSIGTALDGAMWLRIAPTSATILSRNTAGGENSATAAIALGRNKIAFSYTTTAISISANGNDAVTVLNALDNTTWDELKIGSTSWDNTAYLNTPLHAITYYPRALTSAELVAASTQADTGTFRGAVEAFTSDIKSSVMSLNLAASSGLIPGMVVPYSGTINAAGNPVPRGQTEGDTRFAICDGRVHIAPDGTSVTTPNLRNRFVVGAGSSGATGTYNQGDTGGANTVTLGASNMPSHRHNVGAPIEENDVGRWIYGADARSASNRTLTVFSGNGNRNPRTSTVGSSAAHENRPPYWALAYLIVL